MDCYSHFVGLKLRLPDGVGLVVNFLIVSEVMCGLLIWCVSWVPAMVEVPTPAETRKFWESFFSFIHLHWQADASDTGRFGGGGAAGYGGFVAFLFERELTKKC